MGRPSLRVKRSNPGPLGKSWIASSLTLLAMTIGMAFAAAPASAHPHVWVTASSELLYREDGAIVGVRHAWTFDDMFSTYALQGIEPRTKGTYSREELADLAKTNVESLREYRYFTYVKSGDDEPSKKQRFEEPVDYYLEFKDGALVLHFTLPFKTPFKAKALLLEIYDPSYFVDFRLDEKNPIKLVGAPAGCAIAIQRPGPAPIQKPSEDFMNSNANAGYGMMFANKVQVNCPEP
jgi:ABC-type uncharacterized transport system substrate-binding protein